ncbi:hypothetical protein ABIB06_006376 [Bradyrhizobium sp. LB8.2]
MGLDSKKDVHLDLNDGGVVKGLASNLLRSSHSRTKGQLRTAWPGGHERPSPSPPTKGRDEAPRYQPMCHQLRGVAYHSLVQAVAHHLV